MLGNSLLAFDPKSIPLSGFSLEKPKRYPYFIIVRSMPHYVKYGPAAEGLNLRIRPSRSKVAESPVFGSF